MANRQKVCKGQKSDSSCTCTSNHECQDESNVLKYEKNINSNINDTVTATAKKQSNECSSDCINCKLLNRLYILLEEIVENRNNAKTTGKPREEVRKTKNDNNTKMSLKTHDEETSTPEENYMSLPNNNSMDDKKCKIFNVYNNNTGSNNLMLCDCDKTSKCCCANKNEDMVQVPQSNENTPQSSAQYWRSVGEIKKQNHVDIACQCTCPKKDSSTQDDSKQEEVSNTHNKEEDSKKCRCLDSAVNTDTQQNNPFIQNLYCSLSNDPRFREAMKLMPCPNIVVLSNGCSCCNKCNAPVERTSVTTNTSEIIVTAQANNEELINLQELDNAQIVENIRESFVTYPKKRELSFSSNIKTLGANSISRSIKDLPRHSGHNNLIDDTTFIVPQDTDFTVAAALVPKSGKKKSTPKSKKRKTKPSSDSKESANDKKDFINSCCQTDKTEEKCEQMIKIGNNLKDAGICCNMNKCNEIYPKLVEKESMKNTTIKKEAIHSCNCTDIRNFVAVITELCAQMNKNTNAVVACECFDKNTSDKSNANDNKDDCLEIHRLAEKIAEIHLKSNQTKNSSPNRMSRNEYKKSIDLVKSTNSDCDLSNCININPLPSHNNDTEECYCKVCPCKKTTKHDRKEKRGRSSINPAPKIATKNLNELEYVNLNKWTQQYPSVPPLACTCTNYECMEEKEIGCLNYNISGHGRDDDNCNAETCPQLRRIIKDCLCGSKNCYCHNEKLNEMKTTAKLERLADEVISTITPCNCMGQQCTCNNNNNMDPGTRRYSARQVCFSSIYHENQGKVTNNTDKEKKLFDKDVNGNPCLNGSKSETNFYIKKLLNTKPTKNKSCMKKLIPSSTKKLKSLTMKPLLPIPDTLCTQINYINSLFPEIYQALSKIKQLTNWESLPQEIVEIVIDKILKREIKSALQQMREGVLKTSAGGGGDNKKNTNILNILLEDKTKLEGNIKQFKNNILNKHSEQTNETSHVNDNTQHYRCNQKFHETINLTEDNNDNIQEESETLDVNQKKVDTNNKPILVQINIGKEKKSRKCNISSISLSQNNNIIPVENASLDENVSSSSIYITENKLGSIKELCKNNPHHDDGEDSDTNSSGFLSFKDTNQPISININIQMEKEKKINLKDSITITDEIKTKKSSTFSLSKNENENTQTISSKEYQKSKIYLEAMRKLRNDLQDENKSLDDPQEDEESMDDLREKMVTINDQQIKKKSNVDFPESTRLLYHRSKSEMPSLEDFLAMNKKIKVQKFKVKPKNIKKLK